MTWLLLEFNLILQTKEFLKHEPLKFLDHLKILYSDYSGFSFYLN